jgi:colicin import membrane protein
MTATSPSAFMLSAMLHAVVAMVLLLVSLTLNRQINDSVKVFELVAGEGDNYAARAAPALGTEGGVKLKVPEVPAPKPLPAEPAPVAPAPPAPKATPPAKEEVPNFKKKIQWEIVRGDAKAKLQIRREREAEAKRLAEEKKRLTKEEFDRAQKNKTTKVARIDGEGIAKGVIGGSVDNKVGGAGGKALRVDNDDVLGAYDAMFKQRLKKEFEPPPGLSDSLLAMVEVRSNMDGTLTNPRIIRSSGSREFDRAILEAIGRVRMPPRPEGRKAETITFPFTMRERDEG